MKAKKKPVDVRPIDQYKQYMESTIEYDWNRKLFIF